MASKDKPLLSRRGLLIAGVAGALATPAKTRKIRVAVLGIGHAHAMGKVRALRSMDEFELVGVCEPDLGQRREHEALEGLKWLSESEVLDDGSLELVAVESRVQENLDYARKCIDAGKDVHLDKPPGEDLDALQRLLEDAGRRNLVVQMGYQWRYHAGMQAAIEAARKGWLGNVYMVRATINKPISRETRVELAEFKGGMMFELGCHMIDRIVALLGKPQSVTGRLRHDSPVDDTLADNTLAVREYSHRDISSFPANGTSNPAEPGGPFYSATHGPAYERLREDAFADWRLSIEGRVARPGAYSLADLKRFPPRTQITRHTCEEGWSAIGEWTGVPLSRVLEAASVLPSARFVNFYTFDVYPDSIDMLDALHPQTILAYGMNGRDLSIPHGAPVRLRVEKQMGYKSLKYLRRIVVTNEFDDFGKFGLIQNGWSWYAGI